MHHIWYRTRQGACCSYWVWATTCFICSIWTIGWRKKTLSKVCIAMWWDKNRQRPLNLSRILSQWLGRGAVQPPTLEPPKSLALVRNVHRSAWVLKPFTSQKTSTTPYSHQGSSRPTCIKTTLCTTSHWKMESSWDTLFWILGNRWGFVWNFRAAFGDCTKLGLHWSVEGVQHWVVVLQKWFFPCAH